MCVNGVEGREKLETLQISLLSASFPHLLYVIQVCRDFSEAALAVLAVLEAQFSHRSVKFVHAAKIFFRFRGGPR